MRIIPAIDLIDGKCVRLTKGDYDTKKTYRDDPVAVAREFEAHGLQYLHLVDLDGARSSRVVNHKVLERIVRETGLKVDFGGGVKSDEDIQIAFESGASQVTVGSIAVKQPALFLKWLEKYGPERIILGADVREGMIAVSGWQEGSEAALIPFVQQYQRRGVRYVVCTEISRDGMLLGPATDLYTDLIKATENDEGPSDEGIRLIASGGIRHTGDLRALQGIGCEAAIIGKAIYEGTLGLEELGSYT